MAPKMPPYRAALLTDGSGSGVTCIRESQSVTSEKRKERYVFHYELFENNGLSACLQKLKYMLKLVLKSSQLQRLARVLKFWELASILYRQRTTKVRIRKLICAFVVRIWHKQIFS